MSYTFSVSSPQLLQSPRSLLERIQVPSAKIEHQLEQDESWQADYCYQFYIDGLSTRGVECRLADGALHIRIMSCSNQADFDLAKSLIGTAGGLDASIESENGDQVIASELDTIYTPGWIESQIHSGPRVLSAMIRDRQETFTIPGLLRDAHFGPRLISELACPDESEFTKRFLEKLRQIRYFDAADYYQASVLRVTAPGDENDVKVAVWAEGVSYLFPKVDQFAIEAAEDDVFFIPQSVIVELLPDLQFIDEVQCLVPAKEGEAWTALVEKARKWSVPRTASAQPGSLVVADAAPRRKAWWQLWK